MLSRFVAAAAGILALLLPGTAVAYLTPEQVLEIEGNQSIRPLPLNERLARAMIRRQEERQKLLHPALYREGVASEPVPSLKPSAPAPEENAARKRTDRTEDAEKIIEVDARQLRILQRLENRNPRVHPVAAHPGAPLAPTGPAGVLVALAVMGSAAWTFWRSIR